MSSLTLAISLKLLVYNTPLFHSEKDTQKFPDKTKSRKSNQGQIIQGIKVLTFTIKNTSSNHAFLPLGGIFSYTVQHEQRS